MEELKLLKDQRLARSGAKQSYEKKITRNNETAMGDCTWMFEDCFEILLSLFSLVKKTFSSRRS